MKPFGRYLSTGVVAVGILAIGGAVAFSAAKKVFPEDKGPKTIDIAGYPKEMQDIYSKLFSKRCSKCHTLARPINTQKVVLESDWEAYTKKMMGKPGSNIKEADRKKIVEFLMYDAKTRKKAIYEKKLAESKKGLGDVSSK